MAADGARIHNFDMVDYDSLRVVWWLFLGLLLVGFAALDGIVLGLGAIFRFVAQTEPERRALVGAIKPTWDFNQLWLILGSVVAFAAWPLLYAASFSVLRFAFWAVLFASIFRPVGFGLRNLIVASRWRNTWDWALCIGGIVPALLWGIAFGNLFLGIPFHFDAAQQVMHGGKFLDLLTRFTLLCGVVSLSMMVMHGACYAAKKLDEPAARRARHAGIVAAGFFVIAFIAAGLFVIFSLDGYRVLGGIAPLGTSNPAQHAVWHSPGAWLDNYIKWPLMWGAPLTALVSALFSCWLLLLRWTRAAFAASCLVSVGTLFTAGFAMFPFLMPSSDNARHSLTVWETASSEQVLRTTLTVGMALIPLALACVAWGLLALRRRGTLQTVIPQTEAARAGRL
jgi:cytochrome d ubiquinol oxidase subunit II